MIGNIYELDDEYQGKGHAIIIGRGRLLWSKWTYPACGMSIKEEPWDEGILFPKIATDLPDDYYLHIRTLPWLVDPPDNKRVGRITDRKYLAFLSTSTGWIVEPGLKFSMNLQRWRKW